MKFSLLWTCTIASGLWNWITKKPLNMINVGCNSGLGNKRDESVVSEFVVKEVEYVWRVSE